MAKATAAQLRNLAKGRRKLAAMRRAGNVTRKKRTVRPRRANPGTGIEGNLPRWRGASAVYSKAYRYMEKYGSDRELIEALNEGDEERIKSILLNYNAMEMRDRQKKKKTRRKVKRKTSAQMFTPKRSRNPAYSNFMKARNVLKTGRTANPVRPLKNGHILYMIQRGSRYFTGYSFSTRKELGVRYASLKGAKTAAQKLADATGSDIRITDARKR